MSDKRITVEEVRAAVARSRLRLMQCVTLDGEEPGGDVTCGCPIGCLYVEKFPDREPDGSAALVWADWEYGMSYRRSFTGGFDGDHRGHLLFALAKVGNAERFDEGYADGQACRVLLTEQETA